LLGRAVACISTTDVPVGQAFTMCDAFTHNISPALGPAHGEEGWTKEQLIRWSAS